MNQTVKRRFKVTERHFAISRLLLQLDIGLLDICLGNYFSTVQTIDTKHEFYLSQTKLRKGIVRCTAEPLLISRLCGNKVTSLQRIKSPDFFWLQLLFWRAFLSSESPLHRKGKYLVYYHSKLWHCGNRFKEWNYLLLNDC